MPTSPALGSAFARRQRRAGFTARQGLRQLRIKALGNHADAIGPSFLGVIAVGENLRFKQILHRLASLDLGHRFDLFFRHFECMPDMGGGVALVLLLLDNARDILGIKPAKTRKREPIDRDTSENETRRPVNILHEGISRPSVSFAQALRDISPRQCSARGGRKPEPRRTRVLAADTEFLPPWPKA